MKNNIKDNEFEIILDYLKKGYTQSEILKDNENFSLNRVKYIIKLLKDKKLISEEEIIQKREEKKKADFKEKNKEMSEKVVKLAYSGLSQRDIAQNLNCSLQLVSKLIKQYKEDNGELSTRHEYYNLKRTKERKEEVEFIKEMLKQGYSPKEIVSMDSKYESKINGIRKIRAVMVQNGEIDSIKTHDNMKKRKKAILKKAHKKDATKYKNLLWEGYSPEEIYKEMNCARTYLREIKKEFKDQLIFPTASELKKARIKRVKLLEKRAQRELREREMIKARAYKEINLEYDSEEPENFSTEKRQKYFEYLIENKDNKSVKVSKQDIGLIDDTLYYHQDLISKKILKFLITKEFEMSGISGAIGRINSLLEYVQDPNYSNSLQQLKKYIFDLQYRGEKISKDTFKNIGKEIDK